MTSFAGLLRTSKEYLLFEESIAHSTFIIYPGITKACRRFTPCCPHL